MKQILSALVLCLSSCAVHSDQPHISYFESFDLSSAKQFESIDFLSEPVVRRHRAVIADVPEICEEISRIVLANRAGAAETLALELFDDIHVVVVPRESSCKWRIAYFSFYGHIEGMEDDERGWVYGHFEMVLDDGHLSGGVRGPQFIIGIIPTGEPNIHVIWQAVPELMPSID